MGGAPHHLVVVPHTHWDREWYRTHQQFRHRLVSLVDGLLDALERDAAFRHFLLDGQTIVVDDYLEVRPHARERVAKLVRDGRLGVGPWHVLADPWLVSGEALIRNLRHGLRRARELGGALPVGYVPDPFGHVGQLPQILAGFGLEGAVLWRGVGKDVETTLFAWEAPDGTRLPTVWLPRGYSHAADLPDAPDELAERLREEIEGLAPFSRIPTLLLMNGSDHAAPQPRLAQLLPEAARRLPDVTAEIGTLQGFLRRALAESGGELPVHRGELRSGLRAPLLPGCASARAPQKRAEFANDALLTRHLEPLATWLGLLGGHSDPAWIDFAWRMALENHPHDSVCGCSVDRVHDEMDARFRRVEELATTSLAEVEAALGARIAAPPGEGVALAAWNPNASGLARAEGDLDLDLPLRAGGSRPPPLHLRHASGRVLPGHAEVLESGAVLARGTMPRRWLLRMLAVTAREFFGGWTQGVTLVDGTDGPCVRVQVGTQPAPGFDAERAVRAVAARLPESDDASVAYEVRRLPRVRLAFTDHFPGHGLRTYRIVAGRAPGVTSLRGERTSERGAVIENAHWRIEAAPDGVLTLTSRRTGRTIRDALRLVSEGDRGDAYNFDPVPEDVRVERASAVRVRLLDASPAQACLRIEARYRVPERLSADRRARRGRTRSLPVCMELRLTRDGDGVEVHLRIENTVRDHRLRLHVRAPFRARRFQVESAFEIAERPIAPEPDAFGSPHPAERPVGTTPQRRFASLDDGELALTVANRGVAEVEAVPERDGTTSLALTLLRAVGWLSRDDLSLRPSPAGPPLATPGAQVPGTHEMAFALRLHPGGEPARAAAAHAFAHPPRLLRVAGGAAAPLGDGARLVAVDDPELEVSAVEPRADGGALVRLVNLGGPRRARVAWGSSTPGGLACVDLAERPDESTRARPAPEGGVRLELRAGQIFSFRRT